MPDTFTTNLNLTKPEVGGSSDTWGTKLNADLDSVDALFGTGPVLLLAKGGTGAATAALARTNLGLDTMATQAASAVAITGGTLTGVTITANLLGASGATPYTKYTDTDLTAETAGLWRAGGFDGSFKIEVNTAAAADFSTKTTTLECTPTAITFLGNTVWHAGNDGAGSGLDADLLDGFHAAYFLSAGNLNAGSIPDARVPVSAVTQHQASLAITESQITNGTILPRLASAETITGVWSYTATPKKTGGGSFLHFAASGNSGGEVTVSTANPSGTPAAGDLWIKYIA